MWKHSYPACSPNLTNIPEHGENLLFNKNNFVSAIKDDKTSHRVQWQSGTEVKPFPYFQERCDKLLLWLWLSFKCL